METAISFDKLNFYWRMKKDLQDEKEGIPSFLPFCLEWNSKLGLFQQQYNDYVDNCLQKVYVLNENVGYLQEGHELASLYGDDFINYLVGNLEKQGSYHGKSLLEIGCGGCYLLERLKRLGIQVEGCDPSPVAQEAGLKSAIPIHQTFYSSDKIKSTYDFIVHYDVLEHIYEPEKFLKSHLENLNEGGVIVFAVPDCTNAIEKGDMSMFIHEHVNYFDVKSLRRVVQQAGLDVLDISPGNGVGTLYCSAVKSKRSLELVSAETNQKFEQFKSKLSVNLATIKTWMGEDTGIYIPLRALPYLCELGITENIRFFDDNSEWHGMYFDGFDIPIQSFQDLVTEPPENVIVFSYVFAEKIKKKIVELNQGIEVRTLLDL